MEENLVEHSNLLELYEKKKTVPAEQMAVLQSLLRADGATITHDLDVGVQKRSLDREHDTLNARPGKCGVRGCRRSSEAPDYRCSECRSTPVHSQ